MIDIICLQRQYYRFDPKMILLSLLLLLLLLWVVGVSARSANNGVQVWWCSCSCMFFFLSILIPAGVSKCYISIDIFAYLVGIICSR